MLSLPQAYDAFLLDCRTRGLRPASLDTYRRQLDAFLAFAGAAGVTTFDQVDVNLLRNYIAHMQDRGLRPESIRSYGRVLRIWLNFCAAEGMTAAETPMRRVRMPRRDKPRPDAFTKDQVRDLLAAAGSARDKAIVLCLLDSGCRVGEFAAWRVGDVDMTTGAVRIASETAKSRMERSVFLGERARAALRAYLAEIEPIAAGTRLWRTAQGDPLSVGGMQRAIRRIGTRAGISPAGPHKYRRTFAVHALRSGMNIYAVADLMGHSTIDLLKHYITADDDALAAAHATYGPVDHWLELPLTAAGKPDFHT